MEPVFGYDDYGQPTKVSDAFLNPQGRYLWVTARNEVVVPVLAVVPEAGGTFKVAFKMRGERFIMSGVSGDEWVYKVDSLRWLTHIAS